MLLLLFICLISAVSQFSKATTLRKWGLQSAFLVFERRTLLQQLKVLCQKGLTNFWTKIFKILTVQDNRRRRELAWPTAICFCFFNLAQTYFPSGSLGCCTASCLLQPGARAGPGLESCSAPMAFEFFLSYLLTRKFFLKGAYDPFSAWFRKKLPNGNIHPAPKIRM